MISEQRAQDQQRFDALQAENQRLAQQLQQAQEKLSSTDQKVSNVVEEQKPQLTKLQSDVAKVESTLAATTANVETAKKRINDVEHPTTLHYRGITLTPGGFFAAEALYRHHAENADIGTTWNSVPYDAQTMSHISEFRATARQSRLSLLANGGTDRAQFTGYFEADFQGSGSGASEVQTNGYSDRIRQLWGRVALPGGWTFAGGQMWSLITTNRVGIQNLSELTTPLIDSSQFIGHDYARQTAFRLTKTFDNSKVTAAFSVENPATVVVIPTNVPTAVSSLVSGLSTNAAPDLIAKIAFDPGFGHYEIKALGRVFRDRLNSTPAVAAVSATKTTATIPAIPATPGSNSTVLGGGIGAAAYLPVVRKKIDFVAEGMFGNIGRYGATGTDVIMKPNGQISPEKSIHVMTGFETHPFAKLDWYTFGSDEYLDRNNGYGLKTLDNSKCFVEATASTVATPTTTGCSPSVKSLAGATTGIWYRFYKGSYGTVQYGAEYTYIYKETWSGKGGAPRGIENMFETSFRYYLP
jgi:hypothetical protein